MGYHPTTEELSFIYRLILDGCSNRDILEEYARLQSLGELVFPSRTDDRFIKARRKELEAASSMLQEHIRRRVDPVIAQRREQHFEYLQRITTVFIGNGLDTVSRHLRTSSSSVITEYSIGDSRTSTEEISKERLSEILNNNENDACLAFGDRDIYRNFLPHLTAEYPYIEEIGFDRAIGERPYELIETLTVLSQRGTFIGTCPVCRDW